MNRTDTDAHHMGVHRLKNRPKRPLSFHGFENTNGAYIGAVKDYPHKVLEEQGVTIVSGGGGGIRTTVRSENLCVENSTELGAWLDKLDPLENFPPKGCRFSFALFSSAILSLLRSYCGRSEP